MSGLMYFGTRERMQWVKCPASGMGRNSSKWTAEGTFLNGGAYVRSSAANHLTFDMNWNFLRQVEKEAIRDYYDGTYGSELIYFLDPFAMSRNVLPAGWANPALATQGGPMLTDGRSLPTLSSGAIERTNLVSNPLPASDTGWAVSSGETLTFIADDGGQPALEAADPVGAGSLYVDPTDRTNPEVGQWVAFGVDVKGLDEDVAAAMALRIMGYGGTEVDNGGVQSRPVTTTGYTRISVAAQVTVRDPAGYLRTLIWPFPSPANPFGFRFRKVVVAVADTETAALAAVETYFDGNTPDTPQANYVWTGEADNSPAVKVLTGTTPLGTPGQGAVYVLDEYTTFRELWIPVPDGYAFHFGAIYSASNDGRIKIRADGGGELTVPMDDDVLTPRVIPTTSLNNPGGGVTVTLHGTGGTITLFAMMAQVLPHGQVPTEQGFISGQGHSGCRFSGDIVDTGYSAPSALDYSALSFMLRETGSWE